MEFDEDRIDDAVLALLHLTMDRDGRAWKGFDWTAMNRLYDKGFIDNPVSKAKSVWLTPEGQERSERLCREMFGKPGSGGGAGKPARNAGKAPKAKPAPAVTPTDLAALKGSLERFMAGLQAGGDDANLDHAQEIAFEAMAARTPKQAATLARKALAVSPRCADAYGVLAMAEAPGSEAELEFLEKAVEAGAAALGAEAFERDAGHFWMALETRPYMRAVQALAQVQWLRGDRELALDHWREMLRLNPNDNQGVRYLFVAGLLEAGRDAEAASVLDSYRDEDSPFLSFARALLAFRRGGDGAASRKALSAAMAGNRHVVPFLTGARKIPAAEPDYYSPGEPSEAAIYVRDCGGPWRTTPGALDWLRAQAPQGAAKGAPQGATKAGKRR